MGKEIDSAQKIPLLNLLNIFEKMPSNWNPAAILDGYDKRMASLSHCSRSPAPKQEDYRHPLQKLPQPHI